MKFYKRIKGAIGANFLKDFKMAKIVNKSSVTRVLEIGAGVALGTVVLVPVVSLIKGKLNI
jgi:hypothetical protein